jgi:prepilin peptidase CpaA
MLWLRVFLIAAIVVSAIGAWFDVKRSYIPNWITVGGIAAGLIGHSVLGLAHGGVQEGLRGLVFSVLGAFAASIIPLFLYRAKAIGGGDVKLLAAIGAICRPLIGIEAVFYAFVVAALYAPARLVYEGKLFKTIGNAFFILLNPVLSKARRKEISPEMMTELRFGPSVFIGALLAALLNWRMP